MPGVRIDRFLASTAVILALSTGSASAEPKFGVNLDAIASRPAVAAASIGRNRAACANADRSAVRIGNTGAGGQATGGSRAAGRGICEARSIDRPGHDGIVGGYGKTR